LLPQLKHQLEKRSESVMTLVLSTQKICKPLHKSYTFTPLVQLLCSEIGCLSIVEQLCKYVWGRRCSVLQQMQIPMWFFR